MKYLTPLPTIGCVEVKSRNIIITSTPDPDTLIGTNDNNIKSGLPWGDLNRGCRWNDKISTNADNDGIAGG